MKTIYKNRHYNGIIPFPDGVHLGIREIEFEFTFLPSCRYELGKPDQYDLNKLYGLSWGLPHQESARFAWRYNKAHDMIDVFAYPYVNNVGIYDIINKVKGSTIADKQFYLGSCEIGQPNTGRIIAPKGEITFDYKGQGMYTQPDSYKRGWGFILGAYFGGNRRAPHKVQIDIKRIRR